MFDKLIAVDAGRYGIKVALYDGGKIINKIVTQLYSNVDMQYISKTPIMNYDRDDIIASINGGEYKAFGDTCYKFLMPSDVSYVTLDMLFMTKVVEYTLVCIGNILTHELDKTNDSILISFSVTDNSITYTDSIKEELIGKHKVDFFKNSGDLMRSSKFEIKGIKFVYQSHMAYLDYAIDDKLSIVNDRVVDSVVFDFGRRTLDVTYIHKMGQLKNVAFDDIGTEALLNAISKEFKKFGIVKESNEIESLLLDKKYIFNIAGKSVDMQSAIDKCIGVFIDKAITKSLDKFGGLTPDKYLITGGGALLFGTNIKDYLGFRNMDVMENPVFSNANGALKIMVRKYGKN